MNTQKTIFLIAICVATLAYTTPVEAQPPGGGGFRGGGAPSFGGGDRGSRGGGPPGGDRGSRGGGPPGGDRGSRGGFDPSGFLSRLDTNGNGILDPNEQQGPAQMMITRMQQSDPSIQPGKPIPLKKITDSFQKMREQRGGGPPSPSSNGDEGLEAELLVPGFGVESEPIPLKGFGPAAEMLAVEVTDADRKEAGERMRRYDRNRDGFLTKDELSSRFAGNPMDFDRNKDGRISVSELSVRYARRRETQEAAKQTDRRRKDDRGRGGEVEMPDVFNGRKSYRVVGDEKSMEGLPGFFIDKDSNKDGQVEMAEFATEWSADLVVEFSKSDLNSDGVITASEAIRALDQPAEPSSSMTAQASSTTSSRSRTRESGSSGAAAGAPIDDKYKKYAERLISRYDANKNGELTATEWKDMIMSPAAADSDRNGRVTLEEYAIWMQSRDRKR